MFWLVVYIYCIALFYVGLSVQTIFVKITSKLHLGGSRCATFQDY